LIRLRCGDIANPPDAVAYPATEEQVGAIVAFCAHNDLALIPFGGAHHSPAGSKRVIRA